MSIIHTTRSLTLILALLSTFLIACPSNSQLSMVAMQDGVRLATEVYLPKGGGDAFPTILLRSPYGRGESSQAKEYTKRGYAYVIQDVRGFGDSEGEHRVFYADGWREGFSDGADTVDWITRQPWCDGHVGTAGGSALGITQALLAPATDKVGSQSIDVAASQFYGDLAYQGGVWRKSMCEGWLAMLKLDTTESTWKQHTVLDDFWGYYDAEAKAPEVTAPAIHAGGWYDIFQQGTIDHFIARQNHGGPGAKGNQRLIMGPGAHGTYSKEAALRLPLLRAAAVRVSHHHQAFQDYWLKGRDNGIMDLPAVYYWTFGDDTSRDAPGMEWRVADTWPPFATQELALFLTQDGLLTALSPTAQEASRSFTYDPADPFPTYGGNNLLLPSGPFDQREVNEGRTDILTFATEPLTKPIEITGHVFVHLAISTNAPDTDFTAKLIDVYPAGDDREILVLDGIQRVKFRHGFEEPEPLLTSAEEIVSVEIDLWSTSWIFNTNHRIGLHVSSSNYPRFEKNPNSGDDWPTEDNLHAAHNTIHMSESHPSALILPMKPDEQEVRLATIMNPEDLRKARLERQAEEDAR